MEVMASNADAERIRNAAIQEAQQIASTRLVDRLAAVGMTLQADDITAVLLAADPGDPRWAALSAYRLDWSLDVLALVSSALVERRRQRMRTPDVMAVENALGAGATWTQIGEAVGSATAVAYERYRQRIQPHIAK